MRPRCSGPCAHRPRIARPGAPQCSEASPKPGGDEELSTVRRGRSATCERRSSSSAHLAGRRHDDDKSGFGFLMTWGLSGGKSPRLHQAVTRAPAHCAHRRCWVVDRSGSGLPVRREREFGKSAARAQVPDGCGDGSVEWVVRIRENRAGPRRVAARIED